MNKKSYLAGMLAVAMMISGCSSASDQLSSKAADNAGTQASDKSSELVLDLSMGNSGVIDRSSGLGTAVNDYNDYIKEWSGGNITVNLYDGGSLGNDGELIEGVKNGTVDIFIGMPSGQVGLIPELAIFDIPCMFTSMEQCQEVLSGDFFDVMQNYYHENGLHLLGMGFAYFRELTSNRAVRSVEDLKGLNIRTMENKYHMKFWSELGANPTPLAFSELYIALEQGLLDAQENPLMQLTAANLGEVQDYVIYTHHMPYIMTYVMNLEKFESYPEEYQKLLTDMAEGALKQMAESSVSENEQLEATCKETFGTEFITLDDTSMEALKSANQAVIDMMKEEIDPEFVDSFIEAVNATEK
ncbi:TRAP transporter substrate-binding protein [Hominifimenecus sp. rT4P-3]|uniref:TRAP transporter substrate-binding protein n=1 Tax=Hominifimenecus sp. rT4P-3 TaxID=3242979 RepID=UPI003DA59E36